MILNKTEKEQFKKDYEVMGSKYLQKKYMISIHCLNQYAKDLGIYKKRFIPSKWTKEKIDWLKENINLTPTEQSNHLNFSKSSIYNMKYKLKNNKNV